jgi:hypothetical protein
MSSSTISPPQSIGFAMEIPWNATSDADTVMQLLMNAFDSLESSLGNHEVRTELAHWSALGCSRVRIVASLEPLQQVAASGIVIVDSLPMSSSDRMPSPYSS